MRAAILTETKGRLHIQDRPIPTPGHGEVVIRVHACGVCHGDLMVRNGDFPFVKLPIVLGHEIAGVVENLGPGVDHPQRGTRVGVPWLFSACGHCKQCIVGDEVLCANGQYVGMTRDGGYQEFIIARADWVLPLPEALSSWDGGADIILQVAPSPASANAALLGLASDGTFVLLAPVPISPDPVALIMRRQRIMGSPSGSRKEFWATLDLAAAHGIRPHSRRFPLDEANNALDELEKARPAGRLILQMDQ